MTQTEYGAAITAIIDQATGGNFVYPDSFEADVSVCFTRRLSVEDAAKELMRDYGI